MDRRRFIAGAVASALVPVGAESAVPSLRALGLAKGIDIGTAVGETASTGLLSIIQEHCTLITPEWQLKPRFLKPRSEGDYNFRPADEIARLAAINGQKLHGHSLFWHKQNISWAERGRPESVKERYGAFIRSVVGRYPEAVSWDVFNEIIPHPGAARFGSTVERLGIDFVDFCFRAAREASPGAVLALNDHSLECAGDWCGSKQTNALRLLEGLLKRGVPVGAVGLQAHLSSEWIPWARSAAGFVRRLGELGLEVYLSELDVDDSRLTARPVTRDLQVAAYYRDFLGPLLDQRALKRIVFWGISDSHHWMVREHKGGGRRPRPALFDETGRPKPAFEAVRRALAQAPAR